MAEEGSGKKKKKKAVSSSVSVFLPLTRRGIRANEAANEASGLTSLEDAVGGRGGEGCDGGGGVWGEGGGKVGGEVLTREGGRWLVKVR